MGDKSGIEWTMATWNPLAGCSLVSARDALGACFDTLKSKGLTWHPKGGCDDPALVERAKKKQAKEKEAEL